MGETYKGQSMMLRSTPALIESCLHVESDYFRLIVLSAARAQEIASGSPPLVSTKDRKSYLIALEEIMAGKIELNVIQERVVHRLQRCLLEGEESSY